MQDWLEFIIPGAQILLIIGAAWLLNRLVRRLIARAGRHYGLPPELLVPLRGVDHRILLDQIVDAVSGESHLGEHDESGTLGGRLPHQFDGGLCVGHGVGNTDDGHRAGYSGKSVAIDGHRASLMTLRTQSPHTSRSVLSCSSNAWARKSMSGI